MIYLAKMFNVNTNNSLKHHHRESSGDIINLRKVINLMIHKHKGINLDFDSSLYKLNTK